MAKIRLGISMLLGAVALSIAGSAAAAPTTQHWLVGGNGHGFQIFERYDPDTSTNVGKVVAFYDYPYRYLRSSGAPSKPGVLHRNLLAGGTPDQPKLGDGIYYVVDGASAAGTDATMAYLEETHIIQATQKVGGKTVDSYFFAPFDFPHNAMLALVHADGAAMATLSLDVKIGANAAGTPSGETVAFDDASRSFIESGAQGAVVYVPLAAGAKLDCNGSGFEEKKACMASEAKLALQQAVDGGWAGVAMLHTTDATKAPALAAEFRTWLGDKKASAVLDAAKAEFAAWRKPVPAGVTLTPDETKLWRMSEAVLRMGQVRTEGGSKGLFLAGLKSFKPSPDFADWSIPWTRDGMYAIVPMAMVGHVEEAKNAVTGLMMAKGVGQPGTNDLYFDTAAHKAAEVKPYRISVTRYFGDGSEESDLGNSQWNPAQDYNVEVDGWGLYLWAVRHYLSADKANAVAWLNSPGYNQDSAYNLLLKEVAKPLEAWLEPADADGARVVSPDASIWEDHNNAAVKYAYTTITAARGFCDLAAIVSMYKGSKDDADAVKYRDLSKSLEKGLKYFKRNASDGLRSAAERLDEENRSVDGAVIEAYNLGILRKSQNDAAFDQTLVMLDDPNMSEGLRTAAGGFRRRNGFTFDYEYSQWGLLTFRFAEAYERAGNSKRAAEIFGTVMENAKANYYVLPELYNVNSNPPGAYYGSRPMVGYAAGAYMMYMMTRAHFANPSANNYDPGFTPEGELRCEEDVISGGSGGVGAPGGSGGTAGSSTTGGTSGVVPGGGGDTSLGGSGSVGVGPNGATPGATSSSSCLCSTPGAPVGSSWSAALATLTAAWAFTRRRRTAHR